MRELTDLKHNAKQPIYREANPAQGWARCLSCDFVGLKSEFKAAQTGPDSYTPTCPACNSDDVVVL